MTGHPDPGSRSPLVPALALAGAAVGVAAAAGVSRPPSPFPDFPQPSQPSAQTVPLPPGLPEPVARWLSGIYGTMLPVVTSVVITGRARIRPFGVWLPARFRFTHDAGRGYRHYIEATWFGRPLLKVNERYLDGRSHMDIPVIGQDSGPKVDQAANLGMWAELAAAAPSVLATDPRVSWRAIDDATATLRVPQEGVGMDEFTVRFAPASGAMDRMEALRYRSSKDAAPILWVAATEPGRKVGQHLLPAVGSATWADQGRPWAVFTTEDIRYNVEVVDYLRARGI